MTYCLNVCLNTNSFRFSSLQYKIINYVFCSKTEHYYTFHRKSISLQNPLKKRGINIYIFRVYKNMKRIMCKINKNCFCLSMHQYNCNVTNTTVLSII